MTSDDKKLVKGGGLRKEDTAGLVSGLAKLARLEVSHAELAKLEREIPDILAFVKTIERADISKVSEAHQLHNVTRPDENPYESGIYTEKLLEAAPAREGNRIVVKQVISRKK